MMDAEFNVRYTNSVKDKAEIWAKLNDEEPVVRQAVLRIIVRNARLTYCTILDELYQAGERRHDTQARKSSSRIRTAGQMICPVDSEKSRHQV